jgi:hypothetical protein
VGRPRNPATLVARSWTAKTRIGLEHDAPPRGRPSGAKSGTREELVSVGADERTGEFRSGSSLPDPTPKGGFRRSSGSTSIRRGSRAIRRLTRR